MRIEWQLVALIGDGLGRVRFVVRLDVELPFRLFGQEVGANERVQVAVHHAVHVADFEFSAMVFDQTVGLHDVRPDLTAEGNVQLALVQLVSMRLALLNFQIVQARAEHLHRHLTILALAALRLAADNDVCGDVSDADGSLYLVDVLAAFATRTECVHSQIFGPDIDFNAIVDFRNYEDRGKGSVAARGLIERGDSNETVNSGFASEKAVGIFVGELDGGRFDASFLAGCLIEDGSGHTATLGPSQVHAKKDGSPILGFRPPRARLDGHDGVEMIGLTGEKRPGFQFGDVGIGGVKFAVQLFQEIVLLLDVGFFLDEMDVGLDVT